MKGALRSFIFSRHGQHLVRPIGPIHSKQHDTHLFPFGIGVHAPVQCRGCEAGEAGDSDSDGGGGSGFSIGDSVASCLFCGPVISTVMLSPVVGGLSGISPPFHDVSCLAEVDNQWRRLCSSHPCGPDSACNCSRNHSRDDDRDHHRDHHRGPEHTRKTTRYRT